MSLICLVVMLSAWATDMHIATNNNIKDVLKSLLKDIFGLLKNIYHDDDGKGQ